MQQYRSYVKPRSSLWIDRESLGAFLASAATVVFVLQLLRQAFAAPIRSYMPYFWYMPDALMFLVVSALLFYEIWKGNGRALIVLIFVCCWCAYSLCILNFISVIFGLKFLMLFFLAYCVGRHAVKNQKLLTISLFIIASLAIAGVLHDKFFGLSWSGSFEGALGSRPINKQWWLADATRRIAGYGISSTETALTISCAMLVLSSVKNRTLRLLVLLMLPLAVYCTWLTQQRATTVWFFALYAFSFFFPAITLFLRRDPTFIIKGLCLVALVGVTIIPFALRKVDLGSLVGQDAPSLYDRTFNVWPAAIDALMRGMTPLFGAGLGAVGEPGLYSNSSEFLSDNLFLNVALSMGMFAIYVWGRYGFLIYGTKNNSLFVLPALVISALLLLNGVTAGIIVGVTGMCLIGFSVGVISSNQSQQKVQK